MSSQNRFKPLDNTINEASCFLLLQILNSMPGTLKVSNCLQEERKQCSFILYGLATTVLCLHISNCVGRENILMLFPVTAGSVVSTRVSKMSRLAPL